MPSSARPAVCFQSDEEEDFRFLRQNPRNIIYSSSSDNGSTFMEIPGSSCPQPLTSLVYIDDYNTIEKVWLGNAQKHITTNKTKVHVLSAKSEVQFDRVQKRAAEINMRVNGNKTQMLQCVFTLSKVM